jgi:hypothetical protein
MVRPTDKNFIDDARRELLVQMLRLGLVAGGAGWNRAALADLFGRMPTKLPDNKSIFEIKGNVTVNGKPANEDTFVTAKDTVATDAGSYVILKVGDGAFIVREKSVLELDGREVLVTAMRLVTGALLSVFGKRDPVDAISVKTPVATIGIRGTGFYTESEPQQTYFCTCYGTTNVAASADPNESETIKARHHDAPRYVLAEPQEGKRIIPAPFKNHNDLELMTIEAIVGRKVPFAISSKAYERARREDY